MEELIKSLKNINTNDTEQQFNNIAINILDNYILKINKKEILITEIEFYINNNTSKDEIGDYDIFTHFHDNYETGALRSHKSGIDITFRNGDLYGGILIRGIKDDDIYIDGPLKVVEFLLEQIDLSNTTIQLKKCKSRSDVIHQFPRVGLAIKENGDEARYKEYIYKNWRYLTQPKKTENGKALMTLKLINDGKSNDEIRELVYLRENTIENYRTNENNNENNIYGKLIVNDKCSLYRSIH